MQRLWLLELGWSDELPFKEENEWCRFIDSLEAVNSISIDRYIVVAESIQLHAFSNASERASKVKRRGPLTTNEINETEAWLIKQDQSDINLGDPSGYEQMQIQVPRLSGNEVRKLHTDFSKQSEDGR
ncbi:hypothetical protein TNCT_665741, partial [Trichonephila clavata]